MACYIVTFEPLPLGMAKIVRERLKALGGYCPIHAYCWAVVTEMSAKELRDHLAEGNGLSRLFVVRSGTEAAWRNSYGEKNNTWLKKNL